MRQQIKQYIDMQLRIYEGAIEQGGMQACRNIVGPHQFEAHIINFWRQKLLQGYHYQHALDFGCGLGRLMLGFHLSFDKVDGVDISPSILKYAEQYLTENNMPPKYKLYQCNGYDLSVLDKNKYDIVYSQIVLHHICVWEIRNNYFKEFYRVLKDGGGIAIQLHGGTTFDGLPVSHWYENKYDAPNTNCHYDVKLENPYFLIDDLHDIGFKNITLEIVKAIDPKTSGPGEHEYTLIVRAKK